MRLRIGSCPGVSQIAGPPYEKESKALKGFVFGTVDDFVEEAFFHRVVAFLEIFEREDEVDGWDVGFDGEFFLVEVERDWGCFVLCESANGEEREDGDKE